MTTIPAAPAPAATFKKDDMERQYFQLPDELPKFVEYYKNVAAVLPAKSIKSNFDMSKDFPEGYDAMVIPVSKRTKDGNEIIAACIAAVPSFAMLTAHDKGGEFVSDAIQTAFAVKLGNSIRTRPDGSVPASMPYSVEDFIESRRATGVLETYSKIAPTLVKAVRQKGLKFMSVSMLRMVLSSTAFATNQFPKINQQVWKNLIAAGVQLATDKKLDPGIFSNWLATRDQTAVSEVSELDINIDELVADERAADAKEAASAATAAINAAASANVTQEGAQATA